VLHERARNQELEDSVSWHKNELDRRNKDHVLREQGLWQKLKEKDEMLRGQLGHALALPALFACMLMPPFPCDVFRSLSSLHRWFLRKELKQHLQQHAPHVLVRPVSVPKGGDRAITPRGDAITEGDGNAGNPVIVVQNTVSHDGVPFMEGEQVRQRMRQGDGNVECRMWTESTASVVAVKNPDDAYTC